VFQSKRGRGNGKEGRRKVKEGERGKEGKRERQKRKWRRAVNSCRRQQITAPIPRKILSLV
jgi:hypothetical protein